MTRDDIIRMAREAGIVVTGEAVWRLCELVAAAEREACAKVAEANGADEPYGHAKFRCYNIADAIRARSANV